MRVVFEVVGVGGQVSRFEVDHCPDGPHRGPQGPNEDLSQCPTCYAPSHAMRPMNETYGWHLADCSLPIHHESYCVGGGSGHREAKFIRGYWPDKERR